MSAYRSPAKNQSRAINHSNVDLPQPEGPTNTVNSPFSTIRSTPPMTGTPAKSLVTFLSSIYHFVTLVAAGRPKLSGGLTSRQCQAAHELLLREPTKNQDRRDRRLLEAAERSARKSPTGLSRMRRSF